MQFDQKFFEEVGLGEASDEERAAFIDKLTELVLGRIALKLSEALSEDQLAKFDDLLDKEGDDAAFSYVREIYPQVDEMMSSELEAVKQQFRDDVSGVVEKLKKEE